MNDIKNNIKLYNHDDKSLITDWGVNSFPDGQNQPWIRGVETFGDIDVHVRITSPEILDVFLQLGRLLSTSAKEVHIKYLYGSRCDKDSYGKKVDTVLVSNTNRFIQEEISRNFFMAKIKVLTPHGFCRFEEEFWYPPVLKTTAGQIGIFPDKSASSRNRLKVAASIVCEKERDQVTGQIIKFNFLDLDKLNLENGYAKNLWVLDDMCDGGATFVKVAEAVKESPLKDIPLNLLVTHGIFSNGAVPRLINAGYNHIYCTNSYKDMKVLQETHKDHLTITEVF